ncbi:MAG: glycosyltransferase family 2 protein [Candidatus Omnitrophota bacterium]
MGVNTARRLKVNGPLVSIITVVLNAGNYLEETIKSVISQDYKNMEYIIIDGGSEDNTVEVINKYKEHISYCLSQKDNGIYEAMNKGLKAARGQYLNFMNAGDCFYGREAVSGFAEEMNKGYLLLCGDTLISYPDGFKRVNKFFLNLYIMPSYHQSMFFHKELFALLGGYNEKYKWAADIDLWQRAYSKYRGKIIGKNRLISVNNLQGFSNRNFVGAYKEELRVSFFNLRPIDFMAAFCIKTAVFLYVIVLNLFKKIGLYKYLIRLRYLFSKARYK